VLLSPKLDKTIGDILKQICLLNSELNRRATIKFEDFGSSLIFPEKLGRGMLSIARGEMGSVLTCARLLVTALEKTENGCCKNLKVETQKTGQFYLKPISRILTKECNPIACNDEASQGFFNTNNKPVCQGSSFLHFCTEEFVTPTHGLGGMLFQPLAVEEYQNENTPSEREKMLQSLLTTRINRGKELLDTLLENSDVCAEDVHCERHRGIGSSLQYEIQRITNPGWVTWLYKNPFLGTAVFLLIVWILWCLIRCVVTFLMRCGDSLNKSQADLTLLGLLSILHSNMDRSFNPFYKSRTKNEDSNKKGYPTDELGE
jgi:hypothetical protein